MRIILKYEKYQYLWKPHKYWVCIEMPILLDLLKIVGVKFESPPLRSEIVDFTALQRFRGKYRGK